ncbi:hypothetical protein ISS07_00615 [Candidatus Woesearchaeota archaeon]|nr:hypothetical protein [Candidatus Woesearchaeota archaeon]
MNLPKPKILNEDEFHQEVLDYIRKELKKGIKGSLITELLVEAGHNQEDIEKHFSHITNRNILIYSSILVFVTIIITLIMNSL